MIKILTLLGNNYGGCLQAVALQTVLKKYDQVETLFYDEYLTRNFHVKTILKDLVYYKRNKQFQNFRKKHLILSQEKNMLVDDSKSIYVVGSDQVWNPAALSFSIRKNFFLSFVKDKNRKYSYAASIGEEVLDFDFKQEQKLVNLLKDFGKISVRESSSTDYLNQKYQLEATSVLDPTLLLEQKDWNSFIAKPYPQKQYILVYTLGMSESCYSVIDEFARQEEKKIIEIFYKKRFQNTRRVENGFGPSEFLGAISQADVVITNSFHGMVFAILYHKNFYVITRSKMNSRIYDLLHLLGLTDRIIKEEDISTLLEKKVENISFEKVEKTLNKERKKSLKFIESMVNDNKS